MRFVVDTMLGKLASCLRILGYDTVFRKRYKNEEIHRLTGEGRILLTRDRARAAAFPGSVFTSHDLVRDQLKEADQKLGLSRDRENWFTRCIVCNSVLTWADPEQARDKVPDFVLFNYKDKIKHCPSCNRFYWPGTHRDNMLKRLRDWGFD